MTLEEIKEKCRQGYTGRIPGWTGYLDWKGLTLVFHHNDYLLMGKELEDKIGNRNDLYYIT